MASKSVKNGIIVLCSRTFFTMLQILFTYVSLECVCVYHVFVCLYICAHRNTHKHTNQRCDYLPFCYGNGNVSRVPLNSSPSIFPTTHQKIQWCFRTCTRNAHTHAHGTERNESNINVVCM